MLYIMLFKGWGCYDIKKTYIIGFSIIAFLKGVYDLSDTLYYLKCVRILIHIF